ncbi:MAG: hypothetical protein K2N51_10830 [Lachnospiraceae bacterium]|nr:hypothetical protein [Lachnospiraceae bacterium]
MHKNKKKKTLKYRLKKLRMIMYTTVSLTVIQTSGIFSLAKNGILYVYSNTVSNAFAPRTYVNIEINEPGGTTYYINKENNNKATSTENGGGKEASIKNPGSSTVKKPVLVRARVIAVIHDQDGIAQGSIQEFTLTGTDTKWLPKDGNGYYYYNEALDPEEETKPLFTDVTFGDISNIPENGYVELHVIVDAIEVDTAGTNAAKEHNTKNIKENWGTLPSVLADEYLKNA